MFERIQAWPILHLLRKLPQSVLSWSLLVQLGILNVIQAMEIAPELGYPLYIAASVDWYVAVPILLKFFITLSYNLLTLYLLVLHLWMITITFVS